MNDEAFKTILNLNQYQVFIFASEISYPLNFAYHCWFVVNLKGNIQRWELFGWFTGEEKKNKSGLVMNFLEPTQGLHRFFWKKAQEQSKFRFDSKLLFSIQGDETSTAYKLATFITQKSDTYPKLHEYRLRSPNSNTYIQWVLNQFEEITFILPKRAIGKNYALQKLK